MPVEIKDRVRVPAGALRLDMQPVSMEGEVGQDNAATIYPVSMLARTGDAIENWWWGKLVHDMSGFVAPDGSVPIDCCHEDDGEGIGFLESFSTSDAGLQCSGSLVAVGEDDQAGRIYAKSQAGIPYQASIFFDYSRIEQLSEGATVQVNGKTVSGPANIVREWTVKGVAICLYGNDPKTAVFLSARADGYCSFYKEQNMPKESKPEAAAAEQPQVNTEEQQQQLAEGAKENAKAEINAELKRFSDTFGAVDGPAYFLAGHSFQAALELQLKALADKLSAKDAELSAVLTKLAAMDRGEATPVSSGTGEGAPAQRLGSLPSALNRFAAAIRLPA